MWRDALVGALTRELPEATTRGVAAGLHVTVQLPDGDDEEAIRREALDRRIALETMSEYRPDQRDGPPVLLLGCAQMPTATNTVRCAGTVPPPPLATTVVRIRVRPANRRA